MMLLLILLMAAPLPVAKQGSCPAGYASGSAYCTPITGTNRDAIPKVGPCPANWITSGNYCLSPPRGKQ